MKDINTETRNVLSSGGADETTFTIKANGKAFKTLIDGLYSNKVRAVCRELMTNAFDSHIANKNSDEPFEVQVPSDLDAVFRVRDFGTSLTHDQVLHLYTTVFESTKDDTNDQVGKLGLGSKSPFAYTDTFTVNAYLKGVKRSYAAFIASDGVPKIKLLHEGSTSEENGLEVSFPVKLEDTRKFQTEISYTSLGFDVTPRFVGVSDFKAGLTDKETLARGNGWLLVDSSSVHFANTSGLFARQGCVIYPIDIQPLSLPHDLDNLRYLNGIIDFPIGSIDIAASREALSYDPSTISNIKKRLTEVVDEFKQSIQIEVDEKEYPNYLEAKGEAFRRYSGMNSYHMRDFLSNTFTWKGAKHSLTMEIGGPSYRKYQSTGRTPKQGPSMNHENEFNVVGYYQRLTDFDMGSDRLTFNGLSSLDFTPSNTRNIIYIDNGDRRDAGSRIRKHYQDNYAEKDYEHRDSRGGYANGLIPTRALWVRYQDHNTSNPQNVEKFLKALTSRLGNPSLVVDVYSLPSTTTGRTKTFTRNVLPKIKFDEYFFNGETVQVSRERAVALDVNKQKEGVYALAFRNDILPSETSNKYQCGLDQDSFRWLLRELYADGILDKDTKVYALRKNYPKSILEAKGWKNVSTFFEEAEAKYRKQIDYKAGRRYKDRCTTLNHFTSIATTIGRCKAKNVDYLPLRKSISKFKSILNFVDQEAIEKDRDTDTINRQLVNNIESIEAFLGKNQYYSSFYEDNLAKLKVKSFKSEIEKFHREYPLFSHLYTRYLAAASTKKYLTDTMDYVKALHQMKEGK
jgi:hypothetical protein